MSNTPTVGGNSGTALDDIPMPACAKTLGYEFQSLDRDARTMRVKFTATDAMLNPAGGVQGGFLTAMLDDVMGSMLVALTNGEKGPISVDLHTQFLRPARLGSFFGEARVKHMTNTTAFTEATLSDEAGEIVASAVQTQRLMPLKQKKGAEDDRRA